MATYFISRHAGAIEWAQRHGIDAERIVHLDIEQIGEGDVVLGTLPVQLVAEVNARGARYLHLEIDIPAALRGADIDADEMERLGAKLSEFRVIRVGTGGI